MVNWFVFKHFKFVIKQHTQQRSSQLGATNEPSTLLGLKTSLNFPALRTQKSIRFTSQQ